MKVQWIMIHRVPSGKLLRTHDADTVYTRLRQAIEQGDLRPGQMISSTVALTRELSVSHHAVTKAMARLVREGWVVRHVGAGTFVRDAATTRHGRAGLAKIGVVTVPSYAHGFAFLEPLIEAALTELSVLGVSVHSAEGTANDFAEVLGRLPDEDVVLWIQNSLPRLASLPARPRIVYVAPDCETLSAGGTECDIVTADSRHGGALAGRHLRAAGCASAVFVGVGARDDWDVFSRQRYDGFQLGWNQEASPATVMALNDYRFVDGVECVERLLPDLRPGTGVFAASDDLAMGICHGAVAHGLRWGRELRLVGFDGQPPRYPGDPALTTIAVPLEEMGSAAARLAVERATRPQMPARRICLCGALRQGETG